MANIRNTHFCVSELAMKTCNILLSAVTTIGALIGVVPCGANASDGARAETLELNKSITRRVYEEGLSQGRFEVPYSTDFVGHGGRATFTHADGMAEARGWREAFPDLNITVDKQVAEQDLVAVRWTARGTNTGTGNGIPATGRAVEITGTTLFRMDDGRIAEEWTCADSLGLRKQLGLSSTPAAAPSN
ncbi:MAG TPA: ester cyclase [Dokdonella sp.]|uniref:ester cyclase n=2 Tax=Dokdonella sp. TaxID=2291710 RepID=UPI002C6D05C9|nr:ester cyclase [Dokdonella sp.]HOX72129.1 ester cyclase [Dokdonella sp.]HPN79847.1 ester cyclase [Dokdonella sp.]